MYYAFTMFLFVITCTLLSGFASKAMMNNDDDQSYCSPFTAEWLRRQSEQKAFAPPVVVHQPIHLATQSTELARPLVHWPIPSDQTAVAAAVPYPIYQATARTALDSESSEPARPFVHLPTPVDQAAAAAAATPFSHHRAEQLESESLQSWNFFLPPPTYQLHLPQPTKLPEIDRVIRPATARRIQRERRTRTWYASHVHRNRARVNIAAAEQDSAEQSPVVAAATATVAAAASTESTDSHPPARRQVAGRNHPTYTPPHAEYDAIMQKIKEVMNDTTAHLTPSQTEAFMQYQLEMISKHGKKALDPYSDLRMLEQRLKFLTLL